MFAPLAASLFRYGAAELPITEVRFLFSNITTSTWSGRGVVAAAVTGTSAGADAGAARWPERPQADAASTNAATAEAAARRIMACTATPGVDALPVPSLRTRRPP